MKIIDERETPKKKKKKRQRQLGVLQLICKTLIFKSSLK